MKKKLLLVLISLALVILSLEGLSKIRQCRNSCVQIYCSDLPSFSSPEISSQNRSLLADLRSTGSAGERISKEGYRQAADKLILEISPEMLGGCLNGRACSGFGIGYVRNDLPAKAKKFVKRHELEHLLQTGVGQHQEFLANLAAGKEYPMGLIESIFFSLKTRRQYQESLLCHILATWKTFKIYFLP